MCGHICLYTLSHVSRLSLFWGLPWMAYTSTTPSSAWYCMYCRTQTTYMSNPKQSICTKELQCWYDLHVFPAYNTKCIGVYNSLFHPSLTFLPTSPCTQPHSLHMLSPTQFGFGLGPGDCSDRPLHWFIFPGRDPRISRCNWHWLQGKQLKYSPFPS